MNYTHVDVFASKAMQGNGLTVVFPERELDGGAMLEMAKEFRQFETIFLFKQNADGAFPARIFTIEEELGFAGHPVIGAAAVLHKVFYPSEKMKQIRLDLSGRTVLVQSQIHDGICTAEMNQGIPQFIGEASADECESIAQAVGVVKSDLDETLPVEVVSTGLPYLLIPLKQGIERVKIVRPDFERFLSGFGAKFVYVFDTATFECRTWDNQGMTEDIATGSAAGPLCAYLVKYGRAETDRTISLRQGRFTGRPSILKGRVSDVGEVHIRGDVAFFAAGKIEE